VGNAELAQTQAPGLTVLAGMVPYNVADLGQGIFHRGTSGALMVQDHPRFAPWQAVFEQARLPLKRVPDLKPQQWGKLLINLNNPVNALSGLTLLEEFSDWHLRRCLAALIEEALQVLRHAGVSYAQVLALPPEKFIRVLRLPNFIFKRVAKKMLQIDPKARSSMADDFALGRTTEIDSLCGEVVRLAQQQGRQAPRNAAMVRWVQDHTAQGAGPGRWSGKALLKALQQTQEMPVP
jgi:2-dehydropantoate 2-reductase